jgi:hypothetical protein
VFPVRYELNSYILFRRNSVLKGLMEAVSRGRPKYDKHEIDEMAK